ncbi:MAG: class IV adenylate cyclase [Thermoprotei archaeon]|nr:MAG: class IV adenylate cyclase [Thermoprotei archaeon]
MADREVEVKFRCSNHSAVREKLKSMGARLIAVVEQEDVYFQHPCKNFAETDETLRLRKYGKNIVLTYKGPKEGGWAKTRREVEVKIDDYEKAYELITSLGFTPVAKIRKKREFYELMGVEVSLDTVEELGNFVEIEDKGGGLDTIRKLVDELGLKEGPIYKSYLELYLEKVSRK